MRHKNEPEIKNTITFGFGLIVILFVIVGISALISIKSLGDIVSIIHRHPLEVSNAALRSNMGMVKMHRSMKDVVLLEQESLVEEAINRVNEEEIIVSANLEIITNQIIGEEGKALAAETIQMFYAWKPIRDGVIDLVKSGKKVAAAHITTGSGASHQARLEQKMLALTSYARNKANGFVNEAETIRKRVYLWIIITVIAGICISIVIALITSKQLFSSLRQRHEAEEQFRLLLEHIGEGVYGLDMNGNCTFANPSCAKILGYKDIDDFLGKNMHALIHYERMDGTVYPNEECKIYKSFRQGKGTHVADEILWKADGTSFPVEYWSYPIFKNEAVVGSVVAFIDISERKLVEEEREKFINKLQKALDEIKILRGILPICSFCKNIRNDEGYYEQIEEYIHKHSGVDFSHTICPSCMKKHYPKEYESIVLKKDQ